MVTYDIIRDISQTGSVPSFAAGVCRPCGTDGAPPPPTPPPLRRAGADATMLSGTAHDTRLSQLTGGFVSPSEELRFSATPAVALSVRHCSRGRHADGADSTGRRPRDSKKTDLYSGSLLLCKGGRGDGATCRSAQPVLLGSVRRRQMQDCYSTADWLYLWLVKLVAKVEN